ADPEGPLPFPYF
nr:zona pellucida-binding protein, AWN-1=C8 fragment [swine, sperm, Peptide Partial, 12 aa] [Sus scrofa]